jgi:elongation factor 2
MAEKMVDKVLRIMSDAHQIRNIAICAHIDHGKTTFSDNLLCGAGMMSSELAGKACQLDFHEDEAERGITIDSASVNMVHSHKGKEFLINLIDTPGHVDFGGDVTRAMRAVDGAIVLCCASEGIMPQTETVLRQALKEKVKPVLFINKVDRLIKELQLTPEQMQERFIKIINDVNQLIIEIAGEEDGRKWQVNVADGSVAFGSAFHNWALSIPFMQERGITFKEIIDAYTSGDYKPLAKKAALHEVILNMVVDHLPNPIKAQEYRILKLWSGEKDSEDGKSLITCDPKGNLFFVIVKIVVDPQAGEISLGRLFSGTMKKGLTVHLNNAKTTGRIQQVFITNGAKREIVDNIPSGNIIGVAGLKSQVGETVTLKEAEPFEAITHIFDPVITKAIEAARPSDLPKLIDVLRMVGKEDPTVKIEINEETGEHLLHGMGELHLEIIENRIKSEKGVEVKTSPPIVVYRETVSKLGEECEGKTPNKHNKFYFVASPLEPELMELIRKGEIKDGRIKKKDEELIKNLVEKCGYDTKVATKVKNIYHGNFLIDMTRGQVHMMEVIELINDMFEDVMNAGPVAKDPVFGVKIELVDMSLHEDAIHRGPAQVYPAVRDGIRSTLMTAKPVIFEPMQILHLEAPAEYMGELSKLVSNKRGQLLSMDQEGSLVIARAKMPVGEMFGFSSDLRSATGGRGQSSLIDQMFERLPEELQARVVKQIRERKGLTDAMVGA